MTYADKTVVMARKPALGAVVLGLLPFFGMCFSVSWWDRARPFVLGLPFNLAWLIAWIILSSLCLWGAYCVQARREDSQSGP